MKGMKPMKEMAQKGLKRCTHACTRSVNEIMPSRNSNSFLFMLFMPFMVV